MAITNVKPGDSRALKEIADCLAKAKKIVMVTGAGISTNCGIPDFRSQDGLYSLIESDYNASSAPKKKKRVQGKDLFDASLWNDSDKTSVFHRFITAFRRKVKEEVHQTTSVHKLIRVLRDKRRLVRCYTQNIDGLEAREGLCMDLRRGCGSRSRFTKKALALPYQATHLASGQTLDGGCEVVPLHGDLTQLRCAICRHLGTWKARQDASFRQGEAPNCPRCVDEDQVRRAAGKRGSTIGTLRPNIVLYGEEHPEADPVSKCVTTDLKQKPDLLLIFGTSLKVHGLKAFVKEFAKSVHSKKTGKVIFVNATPPAESTWKDFIDYWVDLDLDAFVSTVRNDRPDIWEQQVSIATTVTKKPTLNASVTKKAASPYLAEDGRVKAATLRAQQLAEDTREQIAAVIVPDTPRRRGRPRKLSATGVAMTGTSITFEAVAYPTPPPTKHKRNADEHSFDASLGRSNPSKRRRVEDFLIYEDAADSECVLPSSPMQRKQSTAGLKAERPALSVNASGNQKRKRKGSE